MLKGKSKSSTINLSSVASTIITHRLAGYSYLKLYDEFLSRSLSYEY